MRKLNHPVIKTAANIVVGLMMLGMSMSEDPPKYGGGRARRRAPTIFP